MKPNVAICESSFPTTSPRARQMNGLYALKPWYTRRLTPILNAAVTHNVSPDVFTAAGVVAAGAAGVAIALGCGRWRRCFWSCAWRAPTSTARLPVPAA